MLTKDMADSKLFNMYATASSFRQGRLILGGNDARCVMEILRGKKKSDDGVSVIDHAQCTRFCVHWQSPAALLSAA
jgi:hypothetical protein